MGEVEAPRPTAAPLAAAPKPVGDAQNDPLKIARFVQQIPKDLLPAWSVRLCTRITDEFHAAFDKEIPAEPGDPRN